MFTTLETGTHLSCIQVTRLNTVEQCFEADEDYHVSKLTYILDFVARFLVVLNSSINFVIYCFVGSQFRIELSAMLRKTILARCSFIKVCILHT